MDTSDTEAILLHHQDPRGVHTLTLNTPKTFNALSQEMLTALQTELKAIEANNHARVLVLAANGKVFCAGHNLKEMRANPQMAYYQALFAQCSRVMLQLQQLPIPVIARVQGLATAAGCQLVAQCDLAVASQDARFGVNGIDVGLFCATPSVPLARNVPAKIAMEMLLTGDFMTAEEAQRRALINRVVPANALDSEMEKMVASILAKPAEAIAMGKALFYQQRECGIDAAYQLAAQTMACNMVHEVAQEGVQAFIEKRSPAWRV